MADAGGDLERRLARLETAEEVRGLAAAYALACDRKDLERMRAILAPDVVVSVPGQAWTGVEEALGFFAAAWEANPTPSRHFMTNVAMRKLEPDRAEATSYFLYVSAFGEASQIGWGTYDDTFVRHDGRLVFHTKHIDMDLLVDLDDGWAVALRQAIPAGSG